MRSFVVIAAALWLVLPATVGRAAVRTETVEYTEGGATLKGYLAYDDAVATPGARRPGVVVVPEWWGLNDYAKARARQLAGLGYVAFAADMYGDGRTLTTADEAMKLAGAFYSDPARFRARGGAAVDALAARPNVDPAKLAAIGYCFGGTTVLELARGGDGPLRGVVSFHGGLDTTTPARRVGPKVLVLTGAADPMVPAEQVVAFGKEMTDAGADFQINVYARAKHGFTNPDADTYGMPPVGYDKPADQRSWAAMRAFLDEVFGG